MLRDLKYFAVSIQGPHCLSDDPHSHAEFVSASLVCILSGNGIRLIYCSQALQMYFGSDHEIIDHLVGHACMTASSYRIEAPANPNKRPKPALTAFEELFIAPILSAAMTNGCGRPVDIDQLARYATHFR